MIDHISCNILLPLPVTKTRTAITTRVKADGKVISHAGMFRPEKLNKSNLRTEQSVPIQPRYVFDAECREFTVGDHVKLFLSGDIVRECEVKGFHRYQLYAKLWV